jgi:eukaryotic-like serine/threonine-protein kinase
VLYELLTGRLPYEFDSLVDLVEKQARGSITPVSELSPEVPQHVEDAVMRSLARNPAYRPASAEALARELEPEEPPTKVAPEPHRPARRGRLWLALAGALIAATVVLGIALATTDGGSPSPTRTPAAVPTIPRGANAQEQARNVAAWLRRNSR